MFFKGYVPTKNKNCLMSFKNKTAKELCQLDEVKKFNEYAGVLSENAILIDVDNFEHSECLFKIVKAMKLNCRVYKTTRGKHFLFFNGELEMNRTGATLAIGLTADIKLGKKNSYSILKFDGNDREILYDTNSPMNVPKWLFPVRGKAEFVEMESGDGRNQALFNYILTLQSANFSVEEARDCIRLINKYVLKDPLPESELEIILRDEAFQKPVFFKGTTFLFDKFAVFLKNNCHIIKLNNQLHLYEDGIYVSGKQRIEYEMLKIMPEMNRAKRIEVFEYLNVFVQASAEPTESNLIAFRNGIYDIAIGNLISFSPDHIITNRIEWNYNPNATSELVDEVLTKISCNDISIRDLLEEIVGYCFYRRNELGKAFIFTGDKSNGKSTFLDMVKTILGERNIAALDLAELSERFKTAEIFGKLANIGDDIGDEFIPNTGVFKKLVTGEELTGERKGQDPFKFHNYAKMLFSANNIPRIGKGKDSGAIKRRLIIVPFEAQFSPDDLDFKPYIKYDLRKQEAVEYLIGLGLKGLKRVLTAQKFTESTKVQKSIEEYEEINNPVIGFFKEAVREEIKIENEPTNEVYKKYQEYCVRCNLQPLSNIEFSKQVNRYFGFSIVNKKIQGKKYRIFISGGAL